MNKKASKAKTTVSNNRGNAIKKTPGTHAGSGDMPVPGNIGQIRDILFGSQMRDYEKRFSRIEERITRKATDVRDEMLKRIDAVESFIKEEVASLNDQLKTEQTSRLKTTQALADKQKQAESTYEEATSQLEKRLAEKTRELRQQILDQTKNLSEEITRKHETAAASLEKASQELNTEKVDRNALSNLFTEIAMRLGDGQNMETLLESIHIENEA